MQTATTINILPKIHKLETSIISWVIVMLTESSFNSSLLFA